GQGAQALGQQVGLLRRGGIAAHQRLQGVATLQEEQRLGRPVDDGVALQLVIERTLDLVAEDTDRGQPDRRRRPFERVDAAPQAVQVFWIIRRNAQRQRVLADGLDVVGGLLGEDLAHLRGQGGVFREGVAGGDGRAWRLGRPGRRIEECRHLELVGQLLPDLVFQLRPQFLFDVALHVAFHGVALLRQVALVRCFGFAQRAVVPGLQILLLVLVRLALRLQQGGGGPTLPLQARLERRAFGNQALLPVLQRRDIHGRAVAGRGCRRGVVDARRRRRHPRGFTGRRAQNFRQPLRGDGPPVLGARRRIAARSARQDGQPRPLGRHCRFPAVGVDPPGRGRLVRLVRRWSGVGRRTTAVVVRRRGGRSLRRPVVRIHWPGRCLRHPAVGGDGRW